MTGRIGSHFELALDSMNSKALEKVAVSREELIQVLAESPFARIYNFTLHSFASRECTLIVPFDESIERPGGIVAGSVLMTVADVAMWLAIDGGKHHTITYASG